jgi:HEPN domain-containing protein
VPIARLNRKTLRKLADTRLEESRVLLENRFWTGAYYMTGLAVECALKSCLARTVKEHDFPDKEFVNRMYVHKLEALFKLNGELWAALQDDMKINKKLGVNWSTVKDWDDNKRYDIVEEFEARDLYEAIYGSWLWRDGMDSGKMVMAYVEALSGTDINFGKLLWHALRGNKKFPASGALWLSQCESGEWHLLIATSRVDEIGPRKA